MHTIYSILYVVILKDLECSCSELTVKTVKFTTVKLSFHKIINLLKLLHVWKQNIAISYIPS